MPHPFKIIPATPSDYAVIQRIAHATWPDTFGDILSPEQIEYMLERMYSYAAIERQVAEGHVFYLILENTAHAVENGYAKGKSNKFSAVGYVSYQLNYLPATAKLHKLYVLPDRHGKGYGRALIDTVKRIAKNEGQKKLRLDVNYQNKAIGLYEHLGFVKLDRFDTDIGNGYLMEDWRLVCSL
ncbi:GNAT family N-acetyltransferase [Lewinella sp. 4G2]|uniref:GNAT family N-acetyltransferase n=1 Tax=Lewinella sp. 4G2 TaxID=1803372 RepID=UPI0007B4E45E|nr:GNAT family N-acetyltransferase [Lewinella sp. 4G2]OAV43806.1 hypothetical protein A3850_004515 [Lewinella sp. 4G2]